jgi:LysM repeat protein
MKHHVVVEGDTMLEIAMKYNINFAILMQLNDHFRMYRRDINQIVVGEHIRVE